MSEIRALARNIGQKIRACRLARNLTQDELAEGYFSKSYISQLERGSVNPSLKSLKVLADKLGVPCGWLLESGSSAGAHLLREATACFFLGDITRSEQIARRAQALADTFAHRDLVEFHLLQARLATHHRRWGEVLEVCSRLNDLVCRTCPSDSRHVVPHRYYWGKAWLAEGNRRLAIRHWERALETMYDLEAPPSFEGLQLLHDLSLLYRQLGDPQAAEGVEQRIADFAMQVRALDDLVAWVIARHRDCNGFQEATATRDAAVQGAQGAHGTPESPWAPGPPDLACTHDLADAEAWARAARTLSVAAALRALNADPQATARPAGS